MPTFQYKAIDNKTGITVKNTVKAENKQELYERLKNNELTPINIEPAFQFTLEAKEDEEEIDKKIKSTIKPGLIQIIGIIILLIIGTISIIPTTQKLFNSLSNRLELPWITKQINNILGLLIVFAIIILLTIISSILYFKSSKGKNKWQTIKYKIPILGKIIYQIDSLKIKEESNKDIDKEIEEINRKITKIVNTTIAILIIFFTITVLIPSIQIYIQAITQAS